MVQLTPEQTEEVERSSEPVRVRDDRTGKEYLLVGEEMYRRLWDLLVDEESDDLAFWYPLMEETLKKEDEDEPDKGSDSEPRAQS